MNLGDSNRNQIDATANLFSVGDFDPCSLRSLRRGIGKRFHPFSEFLFTNCFVQKSNTSPILPITYYPSMFYIKFALNTYNKEPLHASRLRRETLLQRRLPNPSPNRSGETLTQVLGALEVTPK